VSASYAAHCFLHCFIALIFVLAFPYQPQTTGSQTERTRESWITRRFVHLVIDLRDFIQCQYSETKVMHFSFNLSRIKGLYMFRALFVHLQEAVHKPHLLYCVRVMSVGCTSISTPILVQSTDITRTQYTKCRLCNPS
jgi:hypothetical protein